jgi:hypothetical protein
MSKRTASWIAWSMCALSLALVALSFLLLALNSTYPNAYIFEYWLDATLIALGFSTVGAVISSRASPENPIGWLFCAVGLSFGVTHFSAQYAIYALLAQPGSLPGAQALAWISSWTWIPGCGLAVFLLLVFPDGRLPSSRWRWLVWLIGAAVLMGAILEAFSPGRIQGLGPIQNPLGIGSARGSASRNVGELVEVLFATLALVAASSLFARLRRARGIESQQLKWFTYAVAVAVSGNILKGVLLPLISETWAVWVGSPLVAVGTLGIPVAMGIAIIRYRLYEIDLIINRTLVYGSLTGLLALFYFGSVTALQYLFSLLTGQGDTLAIVASTLAIAALFNPLRRRIQSFIDRRFYRRKYDARKILEAFGTKLRDQTDLEKLCEDLAEVVDETMQPAHLSVILRSEVASTTSTKEQGQQDQQTTRHEED